MNDSDRVRTATQRRGGVGSSVGRDPETYTATLSDSNFCRIVVCFKRCQKQCFEIIKKYIKVITCELAAIQIGCRTQSTQQIDISMAQVKLCL
jgi:hypothetical protein